MDEKKTVIGYELSFTKYFYKPRELKSVQEIVSDLTELENSTDGVTEEIFADLKVVQGTAPTEWETDRLAMLFSENKTLNADREETNALQFKFGTIIRKPKTKIDESLLKTWEKYTVVHPSDIMINGLNLNYDFVTDRVGIVKEDGIITSAYISLHPRANVNSRFYTYFFKAVDAQKIFHGMGTGIRLTLSYKELKSFELPTPSKDEQMHVVDYLDWQVSKINTLINAKKKQIELLEELRTKIVADVITGKVNVSEIVVPEYEFVEETAEEELDIDLGAEEDAEQED